MPWHAGVTEVQPCGRPRRVLRDTYETTSPSSLSGSRGMSRAGPACPSRWQQFRDLRIGQWVQVHRATWYYSAACPSGAQWDGYEPRLGCREPRRLETLCGAVVLGFVRNRWGGLYTGGLRRRQLRPPCVALLRLAADFVRLNHAMHFVQRVSVTRSVHGFQRSVTTQ